MSYEKHDEELQLRIEQYKEVTTIAKSLHTEKTEVELEFLNSRLENYSSFMSETIRTESMERPNETTRLRYRAEGILNGIWNGIVKLIKYILKLIDNTIYAARDFVFGKPTGLQNTSKAKEFSKTVGVSTFTVPRGSPLHNILVREGSDSQYVKTAGHILMGIENSMVSYAYAANVSALKEVLRSFKENKKKQTPEIAKAVAQELKRVYDSIFAGINRSEVKATSGLRFSARSLLYYENDNYELAPSVYTVPVERFPREPFDVPGTMILRCIDLIEGVTKDLDKLIAFEQKEAKAFLESTENEIKEKSKQNPDPEEIESLRQCLATVKNIAVVIGKFQETFKPLRDFKWIDDIKKVTPTNTP